MKDIQGVFWGCPRIEALFWPGLEGYVTALTGSPHHEYPASQIAAETQCSSRYFSEKVSVAISVELWYMFMLQGGPVKIWSRQDLCANLFAGSG